MNNKVKAIRDEIADLCTEINFDITQIEDPTPILKPLFKEEILTSETLDILYNALEDASDNMHKALELTKLSHSKEKGITPKQKTLVSLFEYVVFGEGVFNEIVEIIAFILIKNHHDLYSPRRMKFISTFHELEEVDLNLKMQFLEAHGFSSLTKSYNRKLRNCIAHLDFLVDENGSFQVRNDKIINFNKTNDEIGKTSDIKMLTLIMYLAGILESIQPK